MIASKILELGKMVRTRPYSVGYHRCEDWLFRIIGVESGYQPHHDSHFNYEYDGV